MVEELGSCNSGKEDSSPCASNQDSNHSSPRFLPGSPSPLSSETVRLHRLSTRSRFQRCIAKGRAIKAMTALRVESMLRRCDSFQSIGPASIKKLARASKQAAYPAGSVLFREGDPPGNCYIVLSGQVAAFSRRESSNDEDLFGEVQELGLEQEKLVEPSEEYFQKTRRSLSHPVLKESIRDALVSRVPTVEGFSLYHAGSYLGVRVAVFEAGDIVGELALLQHQTRVASCKCLEDTELVIVEKHEFDNVLKSEMLRAQEEKLQFLMKHMPGMRDAPSEKPGKPHASYFFRKISVCKGHEFLVQGQIAEEAFFVVCQGCVEFRRHETSASAAEPSRRKEPRSMSRPCLLGRLVYEDASATKTVRHVGTLLEGGVFGSLPITDLAEPEPFTVVAGTSVEVFAVFVADIPRLPRKLVDTIRESLMQTTIGRLDRLQSCRSSCILLEKSVVGKAATTVGLKADFSRTLPLRHKLHLPLTLQQDSASLSTPSRAMRRSGTEQALKQSVVSDLNPEKARLTLSRLPSLMGISSQ